MQLFGTTGQAKNLAKGRDGPRHPKSGMGRAGTPKIRDRTQDKAEKDVLKQEKDVLNRKGRSKTGKDVLKLKNNVLKQEICFVFFKFILSQEVLGQRSLSRDICFSPCPGKVQIHGHV